jgi:hypothetical protein
VVPANNAAAANAEGRKLGSLSTPMTARLVPVQVGGRGYFCTDRAAFGDEASLYRGRWRSIAMSWACGRHPCERRDSTTKMPRTPTEKTGLKICRASSRSKKREARRRRMFRTKLDELANRSASGVDAAYGYLTTWATRGPLSRAQIL